MGDERCFSNPHQKEVQCCASSDSHTHQTEPEPEVPQALKSVLRQAVEASMVEVDSAYLPQSHDISIYTGSAGVALLHIHLATTLYRSNPSERSRHLDTALSLLSPPLTHPRGQRQTFLCGAAGPLALAAVTHGHLGNHREAQEYVEKVKLVYTENKSAFSSLPSELLFGHAGYLYALLYLNTHIPGAVEDTLISEVATLLMDTGERGREAGVPSPIMYTWHDKHYLGAAHGLAGILLILLQVPVASLRARITGLVCSCLDYLLSLQLPSGNFPSSLENLTSDRLIHWCHGAPGFVHLLSQAYTEFGDDRYLEAAVRCGEVVWQRGLLRKGYGLCHGVAGNAYTFLRLYQLTGKPHYLHRTLRFAEWCLTRSQRETRTPDRPFSLFEGMAGTLYFYADILHGPKTASFPALYLPTVTDTLSLSN